jgi:hypothetical protein
LSEFGKPFIGNQRQPIRANAPTGWQRCLSLFHPDPFPCLFLLFICSAYNPVSAVEQITFNTVESEFFQVLKPGFAPK